ncbi:GerAB/ArcD/ProY family transporter [Paenibacillus sp. CAA11]|uniref:GerAB/ArcD/ProY family transporter n=1 Tax=Paenibacillus sp. CAA11 TaxID=1532905 RepID=UPI00131EE447|nr:endospore germination permease [Paenibacillus sp. CAA11]
MTDGNISVRQLGSLIFLCYIGDMILLFPSTIAGMAEQNAWISCLLGIPGGLAVIWLLLKVSSLYPEMSLVEMSRSTMGKWLGTAVSLWYMYYFLISSAYLVREMGDFMTTMIYIQTPLPVIHLLFVLVIVLALLVGLESIGRSSEIALPLFILFAAILIVCLAPKVDLHHLRPFGEGGMRSTLYGLLFTTGYSFGEMCVFLMILPSVRRKPHMNREILLITGLSSLLLCLIVFMSLSVMGASLTKLTVYPTYFLAQLINIGNFVQRIEAIMATAWLLTIFFKTVIYMYAFTKGCAQTFGLRNFHSLILPAGLLLFGLAMEVSPNVEYYLKTILPYWIGWDTTNGIILPLLLLIVYGVRKKWTQSHSL